MSQQQAKIVQECMAKLTEKFASKIEATVTGMFEGLTKAHAEVVATLKHEILQLKDSQDYICSKYETLKKDHEVLHATNTKQEKELCLLKENAELQQKKGY